MVSFCFLLLSHRFCILCVPCGVLWCPYVFLNGFPMFLWWYLQSCADKENTCRLIPDAQVPHQKREHIMWIWIILDAFSMILAPWFISLAWHPYGPIPRRSIYGIMNFICYIALDICFSGYHKQHFSFTSLSLLSHFSLTSFSLLSHFSSVSFHFLYAKQAPTDEKVVRSTFKSELWSKGRVKPLQKVGLEISTGSTDF